MVKNKQKIVKILENKKVAGNYFKLAVISPWPVNIIKPGQFLEVKINDGIAPLLRKPLGIHRVAGRQSPGAGKIEILYEVVGEGTALLSKKKPGDVLDIIGPLGNGFDCESPVTGHRSPVLVAGGVGAAPLMALAEELVRQSPVASHQSQNASNILVLLGAKTKSDILCKKEFKKLGCSIEITTDDGSEGHKGFVTDLLKSVLADRQTGGPATIYACGPKPMLKEVSRITGAKQIPCQVLLEEYMACGVGVCLGCAVKVKTGYGMRSTGYGYKMVCKDGPVFEANEVIWD